MKKSSNIITGITAVSLIAGMCVMPAVAPEKPVTAYAEDTDYGYTWVVEPDIQADDINPAYEMAWKVNYGHFIESEYHIIKRNDKFGVIDLEGNIIATPQYSFFASDANNHIVLSNDIYDRTFAFCVKFGKTVNFTSPDCPLCKEELSTTANGNYGCYDKEKNSFARTGSAIPSNEHGGAGSMTEQNSEGIINGNYLETAHLATFNNDSNKTITYYNKFGIVSNGNIILDFDYDSALTFKDGITSLRKDGKWYYFDENGNQVIDTACDGALNLGYSCDWETNKYFYNTYVPYLPSDGYIAINNENGGGYYDVNGNNIIPVGEFESVRPVHDGKAWVKSDGLWGVIDLTGSISVPTETTTTEPITTTTANGNNATDIGNVTGNNSNNNTNGANANANNNNSNNTATSDGKSSPKTGVAGVGVAMTSIAVAFGMAFISRKKNK